MSLSLSKENDEKAIALIRQLLDLGVDVELATSDTGSGGGRSAARTAYASWQTHNTDATPLRH